MICHAYNNEYGLNEISHNEKERLNSGYTSVMWEQWTDVKNEYFVNRDIGMIVIKQWLNTAQLSDKINWEKEYY